MDVALSGGAKVVDSYLDSVTKYGIDIIEISSIARSIDDDDMCRLIESATKKGIKVINEIGVAFAHSEIAEKKHICGETNPAIKKIFLMRDRGKSFWNPRD